MIVSRKVPEIVKAPVYVSDTQYEIWYSKPVSLGKVDKIGSYWYTLDGMRFRSSRDAMEYLIRMHETGTELVPRTKEPKARLRKAPERKVVPPSLVNDDTLRELLSLLKKLTHTTHTEESVSAPIIRTRRRDKSEDGGDTPPIQ